MTDSPPKTFGEYSEVCPDKLGVPIERRPANALCVEYMDPAPRCKQQSPDGRGSIWLLSGGSPLAYGRCCRELCPRLSAERDSLDAMAREFEEAVREIVGRINAGRVLLTERVRAGKRRAISVGPYRTATSKKQYGVIVTPPPAGEDDLRVYGGADRAAREFVRIVGVAEAKSALGREARKSG